MKHHLSCIIAVAISHQNAALAFTNPSCKSAPVALSSNAASAMVDNDIYVQADNDGSPREILNDNNELALLLPGQTLRIQIGDISASRKAWKKRRRNASPILIPCSVLGMNREWMVRWNVMTLLHMVGEESSAAGGAVGATAGKIGRAYRQRLGGHLLNHATTLGYDSVESLLQALFDERIQAEYGISTFVEPQHGNLMLTTALTRRQARNFSSSAGMVQFRPETAQDGYQLEGNDKMIHTGMATLRLSSSIGKQPKFTQEPLGAALRVSPYDEAAQRYQPGDELNAFVYSYDVQGDNESPLLVLTADDPRGKGVALGGTGTFGSSTRVFKRRNIKGGDLVEDASIERDLNELSAGAGPLEATVVAVSSHSSAAFVDCGVGRKRGKKYGGGVTKVLGMLRFEDIDRDATSVDDLGIEAGDSIQVYIKAVSPQSGRFMVTLDPTVKNKKPKDLKQEKQADKRKERLESQIGQEDIATLVGNVYDGIVKAKSKTGDWYYVQPCIGELGESVETCDTSLPVGVATFLSESNGDSEEEDGGSNQHSYSEGDHVRVRLEGIDERRGQLALTLLD
mmetsp:Transcript_22479/g.54376  ORF Transcript_22479/g.54376 Transcript_22479/m.54376 type:complete len:569 (-) Transcript_22479:89-1795(-)|eukprot:CAMPEP_0181128692 /NCGR_PEP_ID=MMETSP1071-20121207/28909_1 /TAXON_ID=35127 /ORGANISM="Thalassiosira sp., Strain NH16" /LENGTH=568 /DNA_ID=CAMNT_0023214599 /DNA_START=84 /DNA_END=1790 /DNA_ORIENTATION=+